MAGYIAFRMRAGASRLLLRGSRTELVEPTSFQTAPAPITPQWRTATDKTVVPPHAVTTWSSGPGIRWRPQGNSLPMRSAAASVVAQTRGEASDSKSCVPPSIDQTLPPQGVNCLFKLLGLESVTEEEVVAVFTKLDKDGDGKLSAEDVRKLIKTELCLGCDSWETKARVTRFMKEFDRDGDGMICKVEFKETIHELANTIDSRVWSIVGLMAAAGLSAGIVIPMMPQLVAELGLTVQEFGMATSAFGAARMVSNLPAAASLSYFGRIPTLSASLTLMSAGLAGLTAASGAATLAACRALTGCGVSGFFTASSNYIVAVSNPLNRARSLSPLFAAFSAGATIGPAVGGYLSSTLGMNAAFGTSGLVIAGMAVASRLLIRDAKNQVTPSPAEPVTQGQSEVPISKPTIVGSWSNSLRVLSRDPGMLNVTLLNCFYSGIMSGPQMTLLPILMSQSLEMGVGEMGMVFAGSSLINVLGAQLIGNLSDRVGPQMVMGPGSVAIAAALIGMQYVTTPADLIPIMLLWSIGNTTMGSLPTVYMSTAAPAAVRANATALLRTSGDLGFLLGGFGAGALATATSVSGALQASGVLYGACATYFLARVAMKRRPASPVPAKPPVING